MLGSHQITSLNELTLSSLCVVDKFTAKNSVAYVAIADGQSFEVYAGIIQNKEIKSMTQVISVKEAQQDAISQIQLLFSSDLEELNLITSAKLDHRMNIWRIP